MTNLTLPTKTKTVDKKPVNPMLALQAVLSGLLDKMPKSIKYAVTTKCIKLAKTDKLNSQLQPYPISGDDNRYKDTIVLHDRSYKPAIKYRQSKKAIGQIAIVNGIHKDIAGLAVYSINDQWRADRQLRNYHKDNSVVAYDLQSIDDLIKLLTAMWDTNNAKATANIVSMDKLNKFCALRTVLTNK